MPEIDLSTLSGPELRGLLDSTRQRGQAAQAYRILQEMAARREGEAGVAREPRTVRVDLGDPLERRDEPLEAAAPQPEPGRPAPPPKDTPEDVLAADLALAIRDRRPAPRRSARAKAPRVKPAGKAKKPSGARREREPSWDEAVRAPRPARKRRWTPVIFATGTALGVVVGAGIAAETLAGPDAPALAVFPQAPSLRAPAAPPPPPVAAPQPAPAAPAESQLVVETTGPAPQAVEVADAAPAVAEPAAALEPPLQPEPARSGAEPSKSVELASAETPRSRLDEARRRQARPEARAEEARGDEPRPGEARPGEARPEDAKVGKAACAGRPADCVIHQDARLQKLQARLRAAYAEALAAHEDRATLRQRQLAWAGERDAVTDPARLARLYEARIRKLEAAAAEARRERGG